MLQKLFNTDEVLNFIELFALFEHTKLLKVVKFPIKYASL